MKKKERRRVDPSRVKENAAESRGGGLPWLRTPKGIDSFSPDRAGVLRLDVLPYEVKSKNHPDRVEPGTLWYKYPFSVHYAVGVNGDQVLCPLSVGKKCPLCEERARLAKNWNENEEAVKALTPQKWVAYNILNLEDSNEVSVFVFSRGKFAEFLENELEEGDEGNLNFYDVTSDGRTLKVRFSEDQYDGRKFFKATRIDFLPREQMDEDTILGKVACLDEVFHVLPYDTLVGMLSGQIDEEEEEKPRATSKPSASPKKTAEEDDDDDDDEDVKPVAHGPGKGRVPKKEAPPPEEEDDDDDDEVDLPKPIPPKSKAPPKATKESPKKKVEDDEDDDEDDDFDDEDDDDDDDE